jgi:choline monooxygenase
MARDEDLLDSSPLDEATALAARFYADPSVLEVERDRVFAASWQLAGHAGELARSGDHLVGSVAGVPVVVVRGPDGVLRAFHNVCRHRAGPLATESGAGATALRCRYHGWTYTLEGRLRAAPEMGAARAFDPAAIALPQVQVREWQGLVFIAVSAAAPAFDEMFAGIAGRIDPVDLSAMAFHTRITYEVHCNWKVYTDNFLEGYHLPHVHPGLSKVLDYRQYDTELDRWWSLQHSPLRNAESIYGEGTAWYFFVFPNMMLNITPSRLQTNIVMPLGVDRCRVVFDYFYTSAGAGLSESDQRFSDEIQREDMAICQRVQEGLLSGCYVGGRLSPRREAGVWHFHNLLRQAYRRGGAAVG